MACFCSSGEEAADRDRGSAISMRRRGGGGDGVSLAEKVLLPRHLPPTGKEEWGRRWSIAG
jgi:hypothetical protein